MSATIAQVSPATSLGGAVRLEYAKSKRRHLPAIGLVVIAAALLFSSAGLFTTSSRQSFTDPASTPWLGLLVSVALTAAMTSPLLVAILASRAVDIEHGSGGWVLARMTGRGRGDLCRIKALALAPLIAALVAVQFTAQVAIGRAAGITTPPELAQWAGYALCVFLVSVALMALHVCLAAASENQLLGLGVGVIGSFAGLCSLFLPPAAARALPWGYYALTAPVTAADDALVAVRPDLLALALFLIVAAAAFWAATTALNRGDV